MTNKVIVSWEDLQQHKKIIPEINPAAVIAMLSIMEAGDSIQHAILDVMQKENRLSEGKFRALVVLHQLQDSIAPSVLAEKIGVTRATVSNMLQKLEREGLVHTVAAADDGRGKRVSLTAAGNEMMCRILPPHYLRVTKLMEHLTEAEQKELIRLLRKLAADSL